MTSSFQEALSRRLARVEAANAVKALMARYQYLCAAGRTEDLMALFSSKEATVSAELADWGVFVGPDQVRAAVTDPLVKMAAANGAQLRAGGGRDGDDRAGLLMENALTTPYVQVDPEATRAQALCMVIGASSARNPGADIPEAYWTWVRYAAELVLDDNEWRILHLRVAPSFRTPYSCSWVETARHGAAAPPAGMIPDPDLPPTTAVRTDYSLEYLPHLDPPIPAWVEFEPDKEPDTSEGADLQRRVGQLEDLWAIENLMSRHEYLHAADMNDEEFETCFARELPDVTFEAEDWGVWEGPEAIRDCYVDGAPSVSPGMMIEHATTTPLIVVAQDGRTAKGVWMSPGHETMAGPGSDPAPFWSWGRYGVDFIKVGGIWKFWHFHIYTTFRTPFEKSWVDNALGPRAFAFAEGEVPPGMPHPSRPVTANRPYHPERAPILLPEPPRPYGTFADVRSFTDPNPAKAQTL